MARKQQTKKRTRNQPMDHGRLGWANPPESGITRLRAGITRSKTPVRPLLNTFRTPKCVRIPWGVIPPPPFKTISHRKFSGTARFMENAGFREIIHRPAAVLILMPPNVDLVSTVLPPAPPKVRRGRFMLPQKGSFNVFFSRPNSRLWPTCQWHNVIHIRIAYMF